MLQEALVVVYIDVKKTLIENDQKRCCEKIDNVRITASAQSVVILAETSWRV